MKTRIIITLLVGMVLGVAGYHFVHPSEKVLGSATSQCDVTSSVVTIGNQAATTILAAGSYQWAAITQPLNATNSVSVVLGSTATLRNGFTLTPATSTSPIPQMFFGYSVDRPYRGAISAISSTGSTTVNVSSCK